MPIDYSKWNNLDDSDDEEEAVKPKPAAAKKAVEAGKSTVTQVKLEKPKEAQGSAWNANNYHFEEQRLDAWGRDRLKKLLKEKANLEIAHQGQTFPFAFEFGVDKLEGLHAHTHVSGRVEPRICFYIHAHICTHTHARTYTHTHTHTHTHTYQRTCGATSERGRRLLATTSNSKWVSMARSRRALAKKTFWAP
eukprot:Tamp_21632.p1 GENE.Tamp_21632~~Tamp_21632.p1  ORF type:complete len:208 (-),score=41.99 Tamp_21632:510-1088(-)